MRVYLGIVVSLLVVGGVLSARVSNKFDLCVVRDDTVAINVTLDELVGPFKAKIERIWKVPAAKQRLVFGRNSTELDDDYSSLADQGYKGDCMIRLDIVQANRKEHVQRRSEPASNSDDAKPIVVEHAASLAVRLGPADTVGSFKKLIQQHWYIPVEAQKLTHGPEQSPMDDNSRTLADYNVKDLDNFDVSYVAHKHPESAHAPSQ